MPNPTMHHLCEEAKVEVLARLDTLTNELVALRRLTAHYWPVAGLKSEPGPSLAARA